MTRQISPSWRTCSSDSRSKIAPRTASTWPGAASASAAKPSSVRTASCPRRSEGQFSRRTHPFSSRREMAWESLLRVIFERSASSVMRIRRSGVSESHTSSE